MCRSQALRTGICGGWCGQIYVAPWCVRKNYYIPLLTGAWALGEGLAGGEAGYGSRHRIQEDPVLHAEEFGLEPSTGIKLE